MSREKRIKEAIIESQRWHSMSDEEKLLDLACRVVIGSAAIGLVIIIVILVVMALFGMK